MNAGGYTTEFGAGWIYGTDGNPVWELRDRVDLDGLFEAFYPLNLYDGNGGYRRDESLFTPGTYCAQMDAARALSEQVSVLCLQADEGELEGGRLEWCQSYLGEGWTPEDEDDLTKRQLQVLVGGYDPSDIDDELERGVARVCEVFYQDAEDGYEPNLVSRYSRRLISSRMLS